MEIRDPYPAALGQKKGRQSERLPNKEALSKRAAKGARIAQSLLLRKGQVDKIVWVYSAQQVGSFHDFQVLQLPGWLHSSKDPLRDTQPTAPFSRPAPPGSQTGKPYPGVRPAKGKICLQQLQMQSIEAYTCVLSPLVQAVETGIAAKKQETALSSPKAPIPLSCYP